MRLLFYGGKQMNDSKKAVEELIIKSRKADNSFDADKYSRSALNCANAILSLKDAERLKD
jgi:hypothetical protein